MNHLYFRQVINKEDHAEDSPNKAPWDHHNNLKILKVLELKNIHRNKERNIQWSNPDQVKAEDLKNILLLIKKISSYK